MGESIMGTNYYWYEQEPCKKCARKYPGIHIGKSSFGWCFSLHVDKEMGIESLVSWKRLWRKGIIRNEYGEKITPKKMLSIITERKSSNNFSKPYPVNDKDSLGYYLDWEDFFVRNSAMPGPKGLLRHKLELRCVAHGDGTWDLCTGEFS